MPVGIHINPAKHALKLIKFGVRKNLLSLP